MKQFAGFLLVVVGWFAAFLRWLDLVNYVDVGTGFPIVGSVWLRYGALALLVLVALISSPLAAKRPANIEKTAPVSGVISLVCAALFAAEAALRFVAQSQESVFHALALIYVILGALTALSFAVLGMTAFSKPYTLQKGGVLIGIVGSFYFYVLLVQRFADNNSSFYRAGPTIGIFSAAAALMFSVVLVRAVFFSGAGAGRKLYAAGMIAFYVCTCFELPQTLCDFMVGTQTFAVFLQSMMLAMVGVLGMVCAQRCLCKEQLTDTSVESSLETQTMP